MAVSLETRLRAAAGAPATAPGMPPEAPLAMPLQAFRRAPAVTHEPVAWRTRLARLLVWGGGLALGVAGGLEMGAVVASGGVTVLEALFVAVFTLAFTWSALAATSAVAGLLFPAPPLAALAAGRRLDSLTALVMPVYNEDATQTAAALQAMAEGLAEAGQAHAFEVVVLSDSNDPDAWLRETDAMQGLRARLAGVMPVFYRRRHANTEKKAGNLKDFVGRWGARYAHMVVLDADSVVAPATLVRLVAAMEDEPRLGILQTVPVLVGGDTLMARLQQFAGRVHGPLSARGLAAWAGDQAPYWGHNAVIRVAAFAAACGLPSLPGRKPFGGTVMSHDFVEAALMCRAGWRVRMAPDLEGSCEASPPSLVDIAVRDRRWAQGNLQHAALLGTRGLRWPSRAHFALGIASYVSSPLWLALLATGVALALQAHLVRPEYFTSEFQLFPTWPRLDAERMLRLFGVSMLVVFLPKLLGVARALFVAPLRRGAGGAVALLASTLVELLLSALYAPVMMLVQTRQVVEILSGRDAGWATQRRAGEGDSWRTAWRWHRWHTLGGTLLAALAWTLSPPLAAWLSPTLAGVILSMPLNHQSGRRGLAGRLRRAGLLLTPEERQPPAVVARRDHLAATWPRVAGDPLAWLLDDAARVERHFALAGVPPPAARGAPDAARLTAAARIRDARTREEAVAWLDRAERLRVAGDEALVARLAALPGAGRPSSGVTPDDWHAAAS